MYDPNGDQRDCTVCNPVLIPAGIPTEKLKGSSGVVVVDAKDAKLPDPLAPFRNAIDKALTYTRINLGGRVSSHGHSFEIGRAHV